MAITKCVQKHFSSIINSAYSQHVADHQERSSLEYGASRFQLRKKHLKGRH